MTGPTFQTAQANGWLPKPLEHGPCVNVDSENAWAGYKQGDRSIVNTSYKNENTRYGGYRKQFDFNGNRLDLIDWKGEQLVPVRKVFSFPHPAVEARSKADCDMIRARESIEAEVLKGEVWEIPKPVTSLEEASFPDWAATILRNKLWEKPTPIQSQAWPVALGGYDVVGIATTGSGKTMAYALPMLVHIMAQPELRPGEGPVGLVMVPTRELCAQVREEITTFSGFTKLRCESIYGGEDFDAQSTAFLEKIDIVTATPGRLLDLLMKGRTNLKRVTYVVIDEADDMLDWKFREQITQILSQVRPDRQVLLFSATWQDQMREFADAVFEDKRGLSPGTIQINVGGTKLSACKDIDQQFWAPGVCDFWKCGETKAKVLCKALELISEKLMQDEQKALVFCNSKEAVTSVAEIIREHGLKCEGFAGGERSQAEREDLLQRFRDPNPELPILVCTNVLGRGHDFDNVLYVVNYDMPSRIIDYIHRIGRTGRRGQKGYALTLLEHWDLRFSKLIVDCLKETGHSPQLWLEEKSKQAKKIKREYENLRHGVGGIDGDAGGIDGGGGPGAKWAGRGKGKRHQFLSELKGAGLARGFPLFD